MPRNSRHTTKPHRLKLATRLDKLHPKSPRLWNAKWSLQVLCRATRLHTPGRWGLQVTRRQVQAAGGLRGTGGIEIRMTDDQFRSAVPVQLKPTRCARFMFFPAHRLHTNSNTCSRTHALSTIRPADTTAADHCRNFALPLLHRNNRPPMNRARCCTTSTSMLARLVPAARPSELASAPQPRAPLRRAVAGVASAARRRAHARPACQVCRFRS